VEETALVSIMNSAGQRVIEFNLTPEDNKIVTDYLDTGIYFIRTLIDGVAQNFKVVKQ
jgi:hypothetical protein